MSFIDKIEKWQSEFKRKEEESAKIPLVTVITNLKTNHSECIAARFIPYTADYSCVFEECKELSLKFGLSSFDIFGWKSSNILLRVVRNTEASKLPKYNESNWSKA
jgi:hypothetical protein